MDIFWTVYFVTVVINLFELLRELYIIKLKVKYGTAMIVLLLDLIPILNTTFLVFISIKWFFEKTKNFWDKEIN
jgi:hypothetical protein